MNTFGMLANLLGYNVTYQRAYHVLGTAFFERRRDHLAGSLAGDSSVEFPRG